ncbi:MAG: cytochrome b [Chromatiales bacterium]|nr:MAG: cytochrome b [Chromatiales bacterium]
MLRNSVRRYGYVAQGLHWLIVLLVFGQIYLAVAAFGADDPGRESELLALHRPPGITILGLILVRLAWRLINDVPPAPSAIAAPLGFVARATHWLLYALLISIPLVGWVKAGSEGIEVDYFGLFAVANWLGPDPALSQVLRMTHLYLNTALLGLVSLHVLAALCHQFWLKDGTLRRMLPVRDAHP